MLLAALGATIIGFILLIVAGFRLAAGEFPQAGQRLALRALRDEDAELRAYNERSMGRSA